MGLTPRQERFVKEYMKDLNATQAAIRAGYSPKTAYSTGNENLRKPDVATAIQTEQDKRAKRLEITADKVLKELALLGFANMGDYSTVSDGVRVPTLATATRDQLAAVAELTVDSVKGEGGEVVTRTKFKLADKRAALVDIGKHLGMFIDRSQIDVNGQMAIKRVVRATWKKP